MSHSSGPSVIVSPVQCVYTIAVHSTDRSIHCSPDDSAHLLARVLPLGLQAEKIHCLPAWGAESVQQLTGGGRIYFPIAKSNNLTKSKQHKIQWQAAREA